MAKVTEEKLKKTWVKVDAQTNQKEDIKRETVFCLDDENETEVQADDTIQGETLALIWADNLWPVLIFFINRHFISISGFRYGSDIVPFSKVDQDQMKYKHDGKSFAVLGFTKRSLVRDFSQRWLFQHLHHHFSKPKNLFFFF